MCVLGKDHNFQADNFHSTLRSNIRGCEVKLCGLKWMSFIFIFIFGWVIYLVILNLGDLDSYDVKCLLWGLIHHQFINIEWTERFAAVWLKLKVFVVLVQRVNYIIFLVRLP